MAVTPGNITIARTVSTGAYPTRTWYADPDTGRISGFADGLAAMKQAVDIALHVQRFHWQIYTPNTGHELDALGRDYDIARVRLQTRVREALSADSRITGVEEFQFSHEGDGMTVSFTVRTVFGDLNAEVRV